MSAVGGRKRQRGLVGLGGFPKEGSEGTLGWALKGEGRDPQCLQAGERAGPAGEGGI